MCLLYCVSAVKVLCVIIIFIVQEKVADFYEAFIVMSTMLEDSPNKVSSDIIIIRWVYIIHAFVPFGMIL